MKDSELPDYYPLLVKIAQGDQQAFSTLYDAHSDELVRHVLKRVDEIAIAEDIVHDLFLSLWNNRSKLLEIDSVPAYLYAACRYLVIAHHKKKIIFHTQTIGDDEIDLVNDERPLEERLYYRYMLDVVQKEIETLPEKCKLVFKMSREQHMSNKRIAEELGISESTVENHINKAISRLRSVAKNILHFFIFF